MYATYMYIVLFCRTLRDGILLQCAPIACRSVPYEKFFRDNFAFNFQPSAEGGISLDAAILSLGSTSSLNGSPAYI